MRVVVVDDSPTVRSTLVQVLEEAEGVQVVGMAAHGEEALRLVERLKPDIVTMDVHMPKMDGLEATRRIMRDMPTPIVMVTDAVKDPKLDPTFEALRAGALTVVQKPTLDEAESCASFVNTVRLLSEVPVIHHWGRASSRSVSQHTSTSFDSEALAPATPVRLHPDTEIVGIAASTGGPAALATLLGSLPDTFPLPILVVQHMTLGFTGGLAEWLRTQTPLSVQLATDRAALSPGTVLIAPDDHHLKMSARRVVELDKAPPYKGLRPSANYLFSSLARVYGERALGIVLTGMGDDGADGLVELHRHGGTVLAQDQASAVVYGMPREAVARQAVDGVLAPKGIAALLRSWAEERGGG